MLDFTAYKGETIDDTAENIDNAIHANQALYNSVLDELAEDAPHKDDLPDYISNVYSLEKAEALHGATQCYNLT